jgi:peptidoglycan LD-endopeptidase CwlK
MPQFGQKSQEILSTCDVRLQHIFNEVIKDIDCTVLCGHRDQAAQDEAFKTGKSKQPWPTSKHNSSPSLAVDVAPYPVDWNNLGRFYFLAGLVQGTACRLGYKIRWGGNWSGDLQMAKQNFNDFPHFEILD